ncbi:MAG: glycosyl hydrolase family 18 protein [Rhodothermales bacterium]
MKYTRLSLFFTGAVLAGVFAACYADVEAAAEVDVEAAPEAVVEAAAEAAPAAENVRDDVSQKERAWSFQVFGYHAWWMRDLWQSYELDLLDKIMFFELRAAADGSISERNGWPGDAAPLSTAARKVGVEFVPTVAILDPTVFRGIFGSASNTSRLIDNVMDVVENADADGVHLNIEIFEPVEQALQDGLTKFVRLLRGRLTEYRPGTELTIFTPGFDYANAYDEAALAEEVDYLIVQGYDMHWVNGPTSGPLAPVKGWDGTNWEAIVDRYEADGVPASKIVITVPYYGYEWPTVSDAPGAATRGDAQTITYAPVDPAYLPLIQISALDRVRTHGMKRDPATSTPYYVYRGADGWYQGWYEDEESLHVKYRFVERRGLAGIAIFLLGYDGGELMTSLY